MDASNISLEKALKSIGGREAFSQKFNQYKASVCYVDLDRDKLLKKYDEKWIAVFNSQVVAHGKKYGDVVKAVEEKNLAIEEVAIKHLSSRKVMTLF